MAKYVEDTSSATLFVNGSLDSLLPDYSLARLIWKGISQLDMSDFDSSYRNDEGGRPAIDPRRLLAVWMLAIFRQIHSSVEVARRCNEELEMRWLCGDCHPQKSTLNAFRTSHAQELASVSVQILILLSQSGILSGSDLGVDGTMIRAAASCCASVKVKEVKRRRKRLRCKIRNILTDYDHEERADHHIDQLKKKVARYEEALEHALEHGLGDEDKVTVTEPEASVKRLKNGSYAPAHNVQAVNDLASGAIISIDVVDAKNDQGQIADQVEKAKAVLEQVKAAASVVENDVSDKNKKNENGPIRAVVADSGYYDAEKMAKLANDHIDTFVSKRDDNRDRHGIADEFHRDRFTYDGENHEMICPCDERLRFRKMNKRKTAWTFEGEKLVCQSCSCKERCCPNTKGGRSVTLSIHHELLGNMEKRLQSQRGKAMRKARQVVCEGAFSRLLEKFNWRRCQTWGTEGAKCEGLWHQLTHNLLLLIDYWQPLVPCTGLDDESGGG